MNYLSIVLSALLQLYNPLEQLDVAYINIPDIEIEVIENTYTVKTDFKIVKIWKSNGQFTISLTINDSIDIVIPGIDELYVDENIEYIAGTLIGKDYSINLFTKYLLFLYSQKNDFSQIMNNKLNLFKESGSPIFSSFSGIVEETGYDTDRGVFLEFRPDAGFVGKIQYWNLSSISVIKNMRVNNKRQKIACVGNTGLSREAHLGIVLLPEKYYEEYKIIYCRIK